MLFDTHAHYDAPQFDPDRDEVLSALPDAGVGLVIVPGCDIPTSRAALALAEQYPFVYAAVGCHPEDCGSFRDEDMEIYRELARHPKAVAIGEVGLDYYWPENPPRELQQHVFRQMLELARECSKPVIVHDRNAHEDCLNVVKSVEGAFGVFHCYSGSVEFSEILLKRGWYLGFDGPITYKNARKAGEVIQNAPLDRLLIETDSPYLSPEPFRGQRNDSRKLYRVAEKIAEIKGIAPEEAARITFESGKKLFGIGS